MANVITFLSGQWTKCTINEDENPNIWFVELDRIQERLSSTSSAISDGAYVAHVVKNLSEVYKSLVAGKFGLSNSQSKISRGKSMNTTIFMYVTKSRQIRMASRPSFRIFSKSKFKGDCRKCGKYGQPQDSSWLPKKGRNYRKEISKSRASNGIRQRTWCVSSASRWGTMPVTDQYVHAYEYIMSRHQWCGCSGHETPVISYHLSCKSTYPHHPGKSGTNAPCMRTFSVSTHSQ